MSAQSKDLKDFSVLTTKLFSAAIGQVEWEHFLDELSSQSGDICTHLIGYDMEADLAIDFATVGYDPEFIGTYNDHFSSLNAWAPGFAAQPAGVPVDCEVMCPTHELIKTEFYNDWLRPQEDIIQGGGAIIFKQGTRTFALGGNIRLKDSERLKDSWLRLVHQIMPHMQQALEVSRALTGARLETAVVASEGLRQVPGIIMLSEAGRIIFSNSIAQSMLAKGIPVASELRGTLSFLGRGGKAERQSVLDFLGSRLTDAHPSFSTTVLERNGRTKFKLRFIKMSPEAQVAFPMDRSLGISSKCTLLIISELKPSVDLASLLEQRFSLTLAEAEVSCLIAGRGIYIGDVGN